jgi:capsular polysaccharide transport system permease protein
MDMKVSPIFAKASVPDEEPAETTEILVPERRRFPKPGLLFILVVILPVSLAIAYYGFLASDVYVSESEFVIHAPQKQTSAAGSVSGLLQAAGFGGESGDPSAAEEYASSRDALRAINKGDAFRRAYTRPNISFLDRFNSLGRGGSFEHLYRYFQDKVSVNVESTTSVTTLTVRAYTPADAYRFNNELLNLTESVVDNLNDRGRQDMVRYAQSDVDIAKGRSQRAAMALAAYRNRSGVVDPQAQSQAALGLISTLQAQLISAKTELAGIERYAPQNPRIPVLRTQIATIEGEIKQATGKVVGDHQSLTGTSVEYQRLFLESDFADKQLAAALAQLDQARDDARRQQVYLERVVQPNLPDAPIEPERLRDIFAVLVLSLISFGIIKMLAAGVREHAQ